MTHNASEPPSDKTGLVDKTKDAEMQNQRYCLFIPCILFRFQNLASTLPTVQLSIVSDITGGDLSDYMQHPLEPQDL